MGFLAVFQPYFDSVQPYLDQFGPYRPIAGKFLYENMGGACFNDLSSCFPPPPTDFCSAASSVSFGAGIVGIALGGRGSPLGFGAFLASRIARMVEAHYCFNGAGLSNHQRATSLAGMAFMQLSEPTARERNLVVAETTRQATVRSIRTFLFGLESPKFKNIYNGYNSLSNSYAFDPSNHFQIRNIGTILERSQQLEQIASTPGVEIPQQGSIPARRYFWSTKIKPLTLGYRAWREMTKTVLVLFNIATLLQEQHAANAAYQKINASLAKPSNEDAKPTSFFKRLFS